MNQKQSKKKSKSGSKKSTKTLKREVEFVPDAIKILGLPWAVEFIELPDGTFGLCDCSKQIIYLSPKNNKTGLKNTLLHEIMHALFFLLGLSGKDDEELIVTSLSSGLYQVMVDNDIKI